MTGFRHRTICQPELQRTVPSWLGDVGIVCYCGMELRRMRVCIGVGTV